jgi:biotin carboxylase
MRNVVFVVPFPFEESLRFLRAVAGLEDVRVLGLHTRSPARGESPTHDTVEVENCFDVRQIVAGARELQRRHGRIHRLIGVLEPLQVQLAQARAELGIDGPSVEVAERFRDKSVMKDLLRGADIPCARHRLLRDPREALQFAEQVGYPIVLKPPAGVGCRSTYRVDDRAGLDIALSETRPSLAREVLAEEFLTGTEQTFETLTLDGEPSFHSVAHYRPTPLEVMRTPWIQYVVQLPRDISGPEYASIRDVGVRTVKALGLPYGMTHMEWFRRPDGSVAVGEIAMRPPGVHIVPMMSHAHGTSLYRAWARCVVDQAFDGPWERRYSVGSAFLRGVGAGRVVAVEGVEEAQKAVQGLVIEARLPRVGQPKSDGYEGEGYVMIKHEDDEVVRRALTTIIETIRVRYA